MKQPVGKKKPAGLAIEISLGGEDEMEEEACCDGEDMLPSDDEEEGEYSMEGRSDILSSETGPDMASGPDEEGEPENSRKKRLATALLKARLGKMKKQQQDNA